MATLINNINQDQSISLVPINDDFYTIYIYLLWNSRVDDDFKIQALFDNTLKFDLEPFDRFRIEHKQETIVYRLQYKIPIDDEYIHTYNENNNSVMSRYQLRMTTKTMNMASDYDDARQRTVNGNIPHQFLFNVHFQNHLLSSSKGSSVDIWCQLCLYTYFLIKHNMCDEFDCFYKQFINELDINDSRNLSQQQLNMFFHKSSTYLPQINDNLRNDSYTIKILLRMLGILSIDKDNFKVDNNSLSSLVSELYDYIKKHLLELLQTINDAEWPLLIRGLTLLMCTQMLGNQTIFNTFVLLQQMKDHREKQESIVNLLLRRLIELRMPVKCQNWTNLFPLATDKHLLSNCLDLVTTIDDYLIVLQHIIQNHSANEQMQSQLTKKFDKLISRNDFTISLDNILSLLTHLQPQYRTTACSSKEDMMIFQLIIKSSSSLRQKINACLENIDINNVSLESICEIFQLDHFVSIISIDKINYLIKTICNYQNRTENFYTTWFICFLCDKCYEITDYHQQSFQRLLNAWLKYIQNDPDILPQIIAKLDSLIDHLQTAIVDNNNDNRLTQFTENMLDTCFQPNIIYPIMTGICQKVTNKLFLQLYEKYFIEKILVDYGNKLKLMDDPTNPLHHLLQSSKIIDPTKNRLLSNLITACTKLIKLNNEEIRYETFIHPTKMTCTYAILFDKHMNDFELNKGTLDRLDCIWNRWIYIGLTTSDIDIWKKYSSDELCVFNEIWNFVQKRYNKKDSIETIFQKDELEFQEKMKSREAIILSLNMYCEKANDRSHAITTLRDMLQEFDEKPIRAVEIPRDLQDIKHIASTLYPFSSSQVWLHFYNRNLVKTERKESKSNSSSHLLVNSMACESDDEVEDRIPTKSLFASANHKKVKNSRSPKSLITNSSVPAHDFEPAGHYLTSVEVLNNVHRILEEFHMHLTHICTHWRQEAIQQWIQLFSEIQEINSAVEILKSNFNLDFSVELIDILKLWQRRYFIYDVCQGCLNLITRLEIPVTDDDVDILNTLVKLDEHMLGEMCSSAYQQYLKQYVQQYSSDALVIWSQFSIATELLDFIVLMSSTDFDNLLETVHDWDDKSVSAKTVTDFATLKYYVDQVYKFVEQLRQNKANFILRKVLACFDMVGMTIQFNDINEFFATCSTELPNMKESHSDLVDKELSKRRQIINIMQKSTISLIQNKQEPMQFDVSLTFTNKDFDFYELSELRDRARLIEYSYSNKMKKDDKYQMEPFKLFITFVNIIEIILNTLSSLYISGHSIATDTITLKQVFPCHKNEFDKLKEFSEQLKRIFLPWENTLCEKYTIYPELTYFSCQQFDMIEQFIYNKSECDEQEYGYHLLKYIGVEPILIRQLDLSDDRQHTAEDRLENLGKILSHQRCLRSLLPQENRTNKKIFLIETTDGGILRAVLSFCHRFDTLPLVNHLFYCTNQTNWMEIRAFIYRCIYSQQSHQLIRPERLSTLIQDQIVNLIRQLVAKEPQHLFRIGIITTEPIVNLQLIDGLKCLQIVQTIHEQDLMNNIDFKTTVSNLIKNCTLLTSRITGLGKSHTIREECLKSNREYIKFPINGDIQADLIAQRMLQEARKFQKGAIHFDIGVIDNCHQFNDLISCVILFRSFSFGQIAVSIPVETPIYIELDCSRHSHIMENVNLFQYIPSIVIDQLNWQKFIIRQPVQFVANYLKAIKDKTIIKKDVTLENFKPLKQNECVELIQQHFVNDKNSKYVTWTQLFIYISVFYKLFTGFSECSYFQSNLLETSQLKQLRMDILQIFLTSADQFTSISVETVRQQQRAVNGNETTVCQQQELGNAIIRWDKTEPFILIFSPTNDPIFVYKTEKDIPLSFKTYFNLYNRRIDSKKSSGKKSNDYTMLSGKTIFPDYKQLKHEEFFQKLAILSTKYLNKAICTKCFRQYDYDTLLCTSCLDTTDLLERPSIPFNDHNIEAFQKRIAKIIESEYVLTADNYIKMLLVFLRVQSGVPVLIMGETGCGKTALVNCLCRKILDDDLHVFRLHAGITDEKIIGEMHNLIVQAENLPPKKRLWIFFDEFNTIFNISLLKEIICERTIRGIPLPNNMVFVGTCNPRRLKTDKATFDDNPGIIKDHYNTLKLAHHRRNFFYTVSPIPETMLEYIWDYGQLDQDTEKTYIAATLKTCEGLSSNPGWLKTIIELISESHVFFRKIEDISSVSLRDIARYCRLYKWFNQCLRNRSDVNYVDDAFDVMQRASLMALLLCYYFRLNSKEKKQWYLDILDNYLCSMNQRSKQFFVKYLENLLDTEETLLINQMQLPKDMALNRALKENIFVLFSCIINRIPVFLCGKPGASKTSAVQILMSSLKGLRSDNISFRKLPELVAVTFQGSQSCTSKSIVQIFERAEKYMKIETNSSLLPVIIFDEIGLAELSIHNPLKVLHEQLEIEECRFGFVGISNWRLDASKMNRALYISCYDPDDKDLELTGSVLSKMILVSDQVIQFDPNIIRGLAHAYFDLQKMMKKQHEHENYFGLRDYYSLIKGIVRDCQKNPERSQYEIIYQQIVINFGGICTGYQPMWEIFCSLIDRSDLIQAYKTPNPQELIHQSLINRNGRHLMLIADRESTIDHVERYITTNPVLNGSVKTLVGSHFEGDFVSNGIYTQSYSTRVLMEIILHAETPTTLVMRNMNHLYDNLYDMFNQNFSVSGRKSYCRIALSSIYIPRCLVHDNFYCVILLNAKGVKTSDPPFLNRFEKHFIKIDELTQTRQLSLRAQLSDWLFNFQSPKFSKHFPLLKHLVTPYSPDYICDLVIEMCQDNDLTDEVILNSCKEKLLRSCSFDFAIVLSLNMNNSNENQHLIEQYYHIHYDLINISQLISSTFEQSFSTKRIIYTYTHIYDIIDYENLEQIREIKLSSIKTELELINLLKTYTRTKTSSFILIIRVDYHRENEHILSLKYNIINQWNELKDLNLWIIFHIQRNKLNQITNDVLFNGWDIIMIDDLNNKNTFIPKEILNNPSYENFLHKYQLKLLENLLNEFIHRALSKFRYEIISSEQQIERYNYLFDILNNEHDTYFHQIFQQTIEYFIKTISNPDQTRFNDWRFDLITNHFLTVTSRSFNEAIQSIMILFYDSYFQLLFHHFERFNLIDSYLYLEKNNSTELKHFWVDCYELSLKTIDNTMMNANIIEVRLINDLKLPFSMKECDVLQEIRGIVQRRLTETDDEVNENDLELFIGLLLREKSSYGEKLIDTISDNKDLLDLYYHDQLVLFHIENNFQLSTKFILKLMTTNTKRSMNTRLIQLIAYPDELAKILRIFEDGFKLLDENILLEILNKQMIMMDDLKDISNSFYSIVYNDEHFHLLSPNTSQINNEFEFDSLSDPFIEISLMNLIELIVCPTLIDKIGDIEQITAIFSSVNQSVLKLSQYKVINLEKLRSFMSLLRCIKTLNPSQTLQIFRNCCKDDKFDASFQSCDHIDKFIQNLERHIMQQQGSVTDRISTKSTLLKLEVEFLKNWLVDHNDQYADILYLFNQTENNLWKYSAKIFSYMVEKLDLIDKIENSYDETLEESDEINQLDEHLISLSKSQFKIHRLFVNRIHMDLLLQTSINDDLIKKILNESYDNFDKSIQTIINFDVFTSSGDFSHVKLIRLLSWIKYYTQLYSFALTDDLRFPHSKDIDHYLTNNKSSFCSTLKLFIFKQIINISKIDINIIRTDSKYRNITWLNEFFEKIDENKSKNERNLIMPIPSLKIQDEYLQVNDILNDFTDENTLEDLIFRCSTNQYLSYCFYLWFIKYYAQYSNKNFQPNDHYRYLFQKHLSQKSKNYLQPIEIKFLNMLCLNFPSNRYFHLNFSMSDRDISIRLVILNFMALTLSFKSFPNANWINTILFDVNSIMPEKYFQHLQSLCLFGLIDNNRIISNMQQVRASVQQQLNSGHLSSDGKYIYQCSENCLYLFSFTHCGIPTAKNKCPFCQKDIGSSRYGVLLERNPPQIKMTIEKGFQFMNEYIEKFNQENKYGNYQVASANDSIIEQKSDHLNSPISYRFLHLFIHSILLVLQELDYLSIDDLQKWNIQSETYFQNHIEKDYELLEKCTPDSQYCYVWLFQLLNSMLEGFAEPLDILNSKEKVIRLEQLIEHRLIIPHSVSKVEEIKNYKSAYAEYTNKEDADNTFINFIDERSENNRRYPFLNFFNVTQIYTKNRIEEFFINLKTMSHARTNYPLTMFLLERIDDWSNIQYLYPVIQFLNYIRDKYNYRISRQQAVSKSIQECLSDGENKKGEDLFKQFCEAWSKINLKEVRYGCQVRCFDRHINKEKKLAFFSLNASKDNSGLILSATMQTIANLQNTVVNYFHKEVLQSIDPKNIRCSLIHTIEREHLLCLDTDHINEKLIKHALVINFEYGKSKDIIYDYEEIEITLRSLISRLPIINTDKFRNIQYQFELYSENNALINDVRYHIKQKQITDDQRRQYRSVLQGKDANDILQYLGSLDYIFTYMQNRNYRSTISTIDLFVNQYIHSKSFTNQNLFLQSTFANIQLEYIIDLYELIEEIAFDKIFRNSIEEKLKDETINDDQRKVIQAKFFQMVIDNTQIAPILQNIHHWISTLKRFMVRILPDYVDLNIPVEIYLKRTDLWNSQINEQDIDTIHIDDTILLKHTHIILKGLEKRLNEKYEHEQRTPPIEIQNTSSEREAASSFVTSQSPYSISPKTAPKKKPTRYRDS